MFRIHSWVIQTKLTNISYLRLYLNFGLCRLPVYSMILTDVTVVGNKHQRKPNRQSRMDNPHTLATSGRQDTGQRQTKHQKQTQKTKQMNNTNFTINLWACELQAVLVSYDTPAMDDIICLLHIYIYIKYHVLSSLMNIRDTISTYMYNSNNGWNIFN
jgi:hypothetical protein